MVLLFVVISSVSPYGRWGQNRFTSLGHSVSCRKPCLYLRTVAHRHSHFLLFCTPCFSGSSLLRFPSGAHVSATRGRELLSIRSMWPHHVSFLLRTCFTDSFLAHLFVWHSHTAQALVLECLGWLYPPLSSFMILIRTATQLYYIGLEYPYRGTLN